MKTYAALKKRAFLIFIMSITFSVGLSMIIYLNYNQFKMDLINNEQNRLLYLADTIAKSIESYISSQESLLQILKLDTDIKAYLEQSQETDQFKVTDKLSVFLSSQKNGFEGIQLYDKRAQLIGEDRLQGVKAYSQPIIEIEKVTETGLSSSSKVYFDKDNHPYIFLTQPIWNDTDIIGVISARLSIEKIYYNFIEPIQFEKKGYASVKTSDGIFIMHPRVDQIGKDVLKLRKEEFPELDWSSLEEMFKKQMSGERGTGIYKSVWITEDNPSVTLKFNGYSPVFIGSDFWIVTVSSDYYEATKYIQNNLYTTIVVMSAIALSFFISIIYVIFMLLNHKKLEEKTQLLDRVQELNLTLEKDIDQRIKLEANLRESRKKFIKLFNTGTQLTFMVMSPQLDNDHLEILEINDYALKRLGYQRENLHKLQMENIIDDENITQIQSLIKETNDESQLVLEVLFYNAQGQTFPVELYIHEFEIEDKAFLLFMGRDITERRQKDALLEQNRGIMIYNARLAAMGEMIASIAHQWRQPLSRLNLIVGNIGDSHNFGELDAKYLKDQIIKSQKIIQEMSSIIDDFLYFFNPNSDKVKMEIYKAVKTSIEMLKDRLSIYEIKTEIVLDGEYEIDGYLSQFYQVILNLFNNSIDVLKNKQDQRLIKVVIRCDGDYQIVEIIDNGGGIEDTFMGDLFKPYFSTKNKGEGTGIGLYISRLIIERNFGGTLTLENWSSGVKATIKMRRG